MNQRAKLFMILAIFMTLLIWFNSTLNATLSSQQSGFIVLIITNFLDIFGITIGVETLSFYVRKGAHFGQFFILGVLWFEAFYQKDQVYRLIVIKSFIIGFLTAVIDEVIQIFTPGRAFMLGDIFIDTLGLSFGLVLMMVIHQMHLKYQHKSGIKKVH